MNNSHLVVTAVVVVVVCAALGLALGAASFLRYQITPTHLQITWLGLVLRSLRLDDIKYISTKPVWLAEMWYCTVRPANRLLVIHRRGGWCKTLAITPRNRFMFRAELLNTRDWIDPWAAFGKAQSPNTIPFDKSIAHLSKPSHPGPAKNAA